MIVLLLRLIVIPLILLRLRINLRLYPVFTPVIPRLRLARQARPQPVRIRINSRQRSLHRYRARSQLLSLLLSLREPRRGDPPRGDSRRLMLLSRINIMHGLILVILQPLAFLERFIRVVLSVKRRGRLDVM